MPASTLLTNQPLLGPVVGLVSWHFVMEAWMYALRIPAMSKYKVDVSPDKIKDDMANKVPASVHWPAENYNHLMEQPTQFYAIALAMNQMGLRDSTSVKLAWTYVGLRIVHSLVQSTNNKIMVRFQLFAASSLVLLGLTAKGVMEYMY
ncbi:hypothetical protein D0869_05496 [Hortaea werneckii]|uniref:Uncharacterized protein n=2 Tax=Hortaea werneckii TaxID=91943 RepID=A0A3M6WX18_HORWE|nr:hypothetical protein KC330_g4105 [Hortaea werneckii]RMX83174.1 hypothetical protein D0869_05496 [Hortaea werneckii]